VGTRWRGLGTVLRQQPYEAAVAVACLSGVLEAWGGRGSGAVSTVFPWWALHLLGATLALGGVLTVGGLIGVGCCLRDVPRVVARRVEQSGQILIAGVLFAVAAGAATYGANGAITSAVDVALAVASAARASVIADTFRTAGRLQ
jgi:hypothetical protein